MKRALSLVFCFLFIVTAHAQTITGKITSVDNSEPLAGVSVRIKGTSAGTASDFDGNYKITVKGDSSILIFSYIGYNTEEIKLNGLSVLDVKLSPTLEALKEVVVTALGIKREEKALGYSVQKIEGDDVSKVKELDVINALSGKISGVNIIQGDGSLGGGGSRIIIRGETSLAGNNDPLYIINGIPGGANDIAPDDIENISVLKGPAAAALYGAKAGAGVILITSKSGKKAKGVVVEYNSNLTFQTPLKLPKYQNKFGIGESGEYNYYDGNGNGTFDDTKYTWGPAFDGALRNQFTGNKPWIAYPNSVKNFYQTGHIIVNNFSVASNMDKSAFRFSYSNTDQRGILPNTGLNKHNIELSSQFQIKKWFSIKSNLNYIKTKCDNNKQVDVRFIPRGIDISALKNYWVPGLEGYQQMNYRRSANNPYFELYENPITYLDSKIIANISINIDITKNLNISGTWGSNFLNDEYTEKHAYSTYNSNESRDLEGYYKTGYQNSWDRTADFLIAYQAKFLKDFSLKFSYGGNHYREETKLLEGSAYQLTYFDIYNLNNRDAYVSVSDYITKLERNSLYAFLNLEYKSKLYLDLTRRDDWSSTLNPANNHFSYPSAVASAILSEIFSLPRYISFWKLRGSIAQVGKDIPSPYYTVENKYYFETSSDGLSHLNVSDVSSNPYLKPESTTGYETGTDIRLFGNRLNLDITYYKSITQNQILKTTKSTTSGGEGYYTTNAGKITDKGLEISLNANPIKTKNVKWEMQINWSRDRSVLNELIDSLPSATYTQQVNSFLAIEDRKGQRRGTFYGKAYQYAPNGKRLYTLSGDTRLTDNTELGNYNPDWIASLNNTISYKNMSCSFLLDLRYGGLIYNEIERKLNMYGLSEATLLNNRTGLVPDGMVEENGSYRQLTLADLEKYGKTGGQSGQEYWATQMEETAPQNELITDTYLKLRELRISYDLPAKWLRYLSLKSLTVSLVGRNIAVWSKVNHIDPETFSVASEKNQFDGDTKVPGYANSSIPSVRSMGITLNCKF